MCNIRRQLCGRIIGSLAYEGSTIVVWWRWQLQVWFILSWNIIYCNRSDNDKVVLFIELRSATFPLHPTISMKVRTWSWMHALVSPSDFDRFEFTERHYMTSLGTFLNYTSCHCRIYIFIYPYMYIIPYYCTII